LRSEISLHQQLKRLGHDIEQPHVALLVRANTEDGVSRVRARRWPMLEEGVHRAAARLGAKVLWRARGATAEVLWPMQEGLDVAQVAESLREEIHAALGHEGLQEAVSVGVGRVGSGFEGV